MPTVSSFHYPSSRFPSRMQRQVFISPFAWRYVALIILYHYNSVRWLVVVACIQTKMLWLPGRGQRSHYGVVIDQLCQHRSIVYISSSYYTAKRHRSSITQNVVFYSRFCSVSGIGAGFFSPPAATSHRSRQQIATPTRLSAWHHTSASTWPKFAQRGQPASTQQIDHRRSAKGRSLWALSARDYRSRGCGAYHQAGGDPRSEDVRRAQVVAEVGGVFLSPPKGHQVLVLVLAFFHFIKFSGLQTRF